MKAVATTIIRPIRIPAAVMTVHAVLAPTGKNKDTMETIQLRLTKDEYSFIKASSKLARQTRSTAEEFDSFLTNLDKEEKIFKEALKRAGIKGNRKVKALRL